MALHSDTAGRARVLTSAGIPVGRGPRLSPHARRVVRRQLELGPFMASFEAGIGDVRDAAPKNVTRVRLTTEQP